MPDDATLALFAIGGYGRGELFPQSDIDLLVLAEPDAQARARRRVVALRRAAVGRRPAGRATRCARPRECTEAARRHHRAHRADGSAAADRAGRARCARCARRSRRRVWPPREFFAAKRAEQRARHARFDDTAYNLEPNLKEGPGGLRDLQTLRWMALRIVGAGDLECAGRARPARRRRIRHAGTRAARAVAPALRPAPGRRRARSACCSTTRSELARALGLRRRTRDNLAVEQLMQGFYRSAALMLRIGERLLQRFEEQIEGERRRSAIDADVRAASRHYLGRARSATGRATACDDLRAVRGLGRARRGCAGCIRRRRARWPNRCRACRRSAGRPGVARTRSWRCCAVRSAVATRCERMARLGVLGRYLPAFGQGLRAHAVRPVPRLHRRPAHADGAAQHARASPSGDRRRALRARRTKSGRACASPSCCCSPACSTTSPRAAAATIPNSARIDARIVLPRAWACRAPTPSSSRGWCASTC